MRTGTNPAGMYSWYLISRPRDLDGVQVAGERAHLGAVLGPGCDRRRGGRGRAGRRQDGRVHRRQELAVARLAEIGGREQRRPRRDLHALILSRQHAADGPRGEAHAAVLGVVHLRQIRGCIRWPGAMDGDAAPSNGTRTTESSTSPSVNAKGPSVGRLLGDGSRVIGELRGRGVPASTVGGR